MVSSIKSISENIARSYGITDESMMPTFGVKGYAPPVVNSPEWMTRIRKVLKEADAADKAMNDTRAIDGTGVHDLEVSGSDDAFALIEGIEGVQGAYIFIGTAPPELVAAAHKEGKEFPFFAHQPNYMVDLDGITFGTKVATVLALDVLEK